MVGGLAGEGSWYVAHSRGFSDRVDLQEMEPLDLVPTAGDAQRPLRAQRHSAGSPSASVQPPDNSARPGSQYG